jgi:cytidyltransferase-like protein
MKSFLQLVEEKEATHKPVVMAFGRMNPPTTGHLKLIDKVKSTAEKMGAKHTVVVSHSQDSKKNPLSSEQKIKHLKRYSSGTHFEASSKDKPTILHHAARLHAAGHDHLTVVAGSDRVKEMHHLLHKYNGVKAGHGHYNFKKISVVSAGHRDPDAEGSEGMSGTKMREHAKNKDFSSFRQGVPSHVSDHHAKELMNDVRKGMGLNEQHDRGQFKAIFVTGGPGSGKDIIIREAIAESKAVELNSVQSFDFLADKQKLSEKTGDFRREAIRNRMPLIINGPADDRDRILYIKEELEDLGYSTLMIFVETSNESSQERNAKLSRIMLESVRQDKWLKSKENFKLYNQLFDNFVSFDNNKSIEYIEEDITKTYNIINSFIDNKLNNQIANDWLENHNRLNIGNNQFFKEDKNVEKTNRFLKTKTSNARAEGPGDIPADNRAGDPNADNIKWDSPKKRGTYTFRTYSEAKGPTLTKRSEPKESNFSQDKDKIKFKKRGDKSLSAGRVGRPDGVGQEYDTRAGGQGAAAGAGLGNQTYSETVDYSNANNQSSTGMPGLNPNPLSNDYEPKKPFKKFKKTIKEFNGFQNDAETGVGGVLGGSSNVEKMDSYKDPMRNVQNDYGIKIKKKKKKQEK